MKFRYHDTLFNVYLRRDLYTILEMKAELIVDAPIFDQKKIWVKKVNKPHFDHPFHFHPLCELTWIEKGHGKLIIGDYVGNFSEGELIMEGTGLPHLWKCDPDFYAEKKLLLTRAFAIYFPSTLIPKLTDEVDCVSRYKKLLIQAERGLCFYGQTKKEIIDKIDKIITTDGLERLGYFLQVIHIITMSNEFKCLASISYKNNYNELDIERFNKVYQFLLKNFSRDISLSEVSATCNMTPNSFCRFFKIKTQKTFTQFLNELRIGHACKLLQDENKSVMNICYESGYNSPVNFFKFFKKITQKTPGEYRTFVRNNY